jgi:hypothetical protein
VGLAPPNRAGPPTRRGSRNGTTALGVTRQRMLAEPALLQRLRRSHQHDPGCDYEPDTGSRAVACLVAKAIVGREAVAGRKR